jgi:predicted dehydrogenase
LGVHHFDLLRFLLSAEVEEVYALSLASNETASRLRPACAKASGGLDARAAALVTVGERGRLFLRTFQVEG